MTPSRFHFRLWDKDEGMHYQHHVDENTSGDCISTEGKVCRYSEDGDFYELNSQPIVMQSTGLLDKNGKEIFESDIIKVKNCRHNLGEYMFGEIVWPETGAMFMAVFDWGNGGITYGLYDIELEDMEIVGNVYENPELLKND